MVSSVFHGSSASHSIGLNKATQISRFSIQFSLEKTQFGGYFGKQITHASGYF